MPSTLEVRRRIASVKNVAQITRALQMVASSKMRRAQERVLAARPYSEQLIKLLSRLSAEAEGQDDLPLMRSREIRKIGILLVTPDKGLAGALSSNVNRRAGQLAIELRRQYSNAALPVSFIAIGRKGRDFVRRTNQTLTAEFTLLGDQPKVSDVRAIAQVVKDAYLSEEMDAVYLVYPKYVSAVIQAPTVVQILPVQPPEQEETSGPAPQYIFEPDAETILGALLERYVETLIYQPLLETVASFYSAQMVAMRNATDNATDLLEDLTLTYNKARQAAITNQILEIVAGANAS